MQRMINYFNSWCNNFNNFNDGAIPSNLGTVWTYRYAGCYTAISVTGAIIIIVVLNIIELVQIGILNYHIIL